MGIKERIQQYANIKGISIYQLEKDAGMSKSSWNRTKNISSESCSKLVCIYTDLSPAWLLTGEGSMLKDDNSLPISDEKGIVIHTDEKKEFDVNDDMTLYHYTNLKSLFGIVGNEKILFSDLKNSNDLREVHNDSGYKSICFCIGNNAYKKPRMWAQYGDNNKGVCIGFKLGKLKEKIKSLKCDIESFPIQYKDEAYFRYKRINGKESLKFKLNDWMHENEYRFISKDLEYIPISKDCIECIYVGVNVPSEFNAITKIGLNSKLRTFFLAGGLLKDGFINRFTQKSSSTEEMMNGCKVKIMHIKGIEDVDEIIGRNNARRFYEEMSNMIGYSHIPTNNYEDIIRENERLRVENENLKKGDNGAYTENDVQNAV